MSFSSSPLLFRHFRSKGERQLSKKWNQRTGTNIAPYFPGHVMDAAKHQHAARVAQRKGHLTASEAERKLYQKSKWIKEMGARFGEMSDDYFVPKGTYDRLGQTDQLLSLERGAGQHNVTDTGDDAPLSTSATAGYSDMDVAAHGARGVRERVEAPAPYNKQLSRRLAEGRMWPTINGTIDRSVADPRMLKAVENMSPSEQKFSAACEYWIRRNLRAMPAHIADQMDFAELVIERCYVSKRMKDLYIVWSTVSGPARLRIEPLLVQLRPWVIHLILRRLKSKPNIPKVHWVYDSGAIPVEMPNKLRHQIKRVQMNQATSIEERVDYLRQLDSVENRLRGVPWFMPYLWAKQQKNDRTQQMRDDYKAMKQEGAKAQVAKDKTEKAFGQKPGYVS